MNHRSRIAAVGCAGLLALGGPALGADIGIYEPPPAPPAHIQHAGTAVDWSGVYAGISGGYGWGTINWESFEPNELTGSFPVSGGLFGGQIGANMQMNNFVLGVEGDVHWSGLHGTDSVVTDEGGGITATTDVDGKIDWIATIRARAGVAIDRVLLYATGGVAFANVSSSQIVNLDGAGGFDGDYPASQSANHHGWVVGGGAELMITDNVSLRGQYLYHQFGFKDHLYQHNAPVGLIESGAKFDVHSVTAGINVHF